MHMGRNSLNYSWSSCIVNQLKGLGVTVKSSLRSICSAKRSDQKSSKIFKIFKYRVYVMIKIL